MKLTDATVGAILTTYYDNGLEWQMSYAKVVRVNRCTVTLLHEHGRLRRHRIVEHEGQHLAGFELLKIGEWFPESLKGET